MLSRLIIKRYCHSHGKSKCYENMHKLELLRQYVNELKSILKDFEQPLTTIYTSSVLSIIASVVVIIRAF